ncbi:HD-GYP domain-containing protein [Geotalea uraniireducens]|uniref:Metal dependent phosphohydrolase n=1 Tax=Geotalea uraniireducens (strain Rf4) TaxID=351605 RepID=A5GDI9_GEOUR|nr:HD-GYP domain-containing protein [Geotalea uraniireducens]ABQ24348.1 metal dependent phosphohydrolase [Geotalea uraniireducens Rf4]
MSEISLQTAQRLVTLLSGAMKGMTFYPARHPAIMQPLQEIMDAAEKVLRSQPEIRLGVIDGVFFIEDHLFFTPTTSIEELAGRLMEKEFSGIIIRRGVKLHDLTLFVSLLGRNNLNAAQIEKEMVEQGVTGISLKIVADEGSEKTEEGDRESGALQTYSQALAAIRDVFKDIESGRIPSSEKIVAVVQNMAAMAIRDPAILMSLSMIKDYDNYTFNHSVNVGVISMALGAFLGHEGKEIEGVGMAGFLHDIGKTRVDKSILNKPGKLSATEFEEMKKHTESGTDIINKMTGISPQVAQAVLGHHLGFNRQGYPEWAREMPLSPMSEIVAVADCYDAVTTLRVYRRPLNPKAALDEIRKLSGSYLNGNLVDKFVEMMGNYPVGTLVRLDNNEIAVVFRPNRENSDAPIVKVVLDAAGRRLGDPRVQGLELQGGSCYASIVDVVDPSLKNIDVASYLNS